MRPEHEHRPLDWRAYLTAYERAWRQHADQPTEHSLRLLLAGEDILSRALFRSGKFELGILATTPGALDAVTNAGHIPAEFLIRHKNGDWGNLEPEDITANGEALRRGSRLISSYRTRQDDKLWIITEWDRSGTTLLLPEEY